MTNTIDILIKKMYKIMKEGGLVATQSNGDVVEIIGLDNISGKNLTYTIKRDSILMLTENDGIQVLQPGDFLNDCKTQWSATGLNIDEELCLYGFNYNQKLGMYTT